MEKSSGKLNNGSTAPGVPQADEDSPVPAEEGAAGLSRAGPPGENSMDVERLEFTAEGVKEMEGPSGTEPASSDASKPASPDASKPAILEKDYPKSEPLVMLTNSTSAQICSLERNQQFPTTASLDMDCLVCFNKYNIYRIPKLLDCQHAFCAVCLKLILRREENTWLITCPLCRKATGVSGGLIRTLQNKEDIMEHLENPDSNPEVHISAIGLDSTSWTQSSQDILYTEENVPADNRLAVQRLVLLLLLLVILTILILPFIYSGMIKWVICLMLLLGLVMSMVLCCTPNFYCRCNRNSLSSCHKEIHIVAIA